MYSGGIGTHHYSDSEVTSVVKQPAVFVPKLSAMQAISFSTSHGSNNGHLSTFKLGLIECTTIAYPEDQANYSPTPAEEFYIHESIELGKEELCSLKREIERLGNVVKQLEARYDECSTYILQRQAVISPIRRLPAEIVGEIFKFYLGHQPINLVRSTPNPWRLGHICRYWRDTILSMPILWSSFDLCHRKSDLTRLDQSYLRMESCLQRSGNSPLSFTFHLSSPSEASAKHWSRLVSECHRWQNANIHDLASLPLSAFEGVPIILNSLHLDFSCGLSSEEIEIFNHAPNLSTVGLARISNPAICLRLPWSQITRLIISDSPTIKTAELGALFALIPNIIVLHLELTSDYDFANLALFTFTHLQELELQGPVSPQYTAILQGINAPQLAHLKITVEPLENINPTSIISSVLGLLQLSSCSLTRLSTLNLPTEGVCQITEFTPALKSLGFGSMRGFRQLLSDKDGDWRTLPPYIQEMRIAKLGYCDIRTPALDTLLTQIENGVLKLPRSLQNIHIDDVDSPSIILDPKKFIGRVELFNTRSRVKLVPHFI